MHPKQVQILEERKRFNVLKCGRRFGKTELTIELAVEVMLDGMPVGYWCPTYKDLYDVWNELKFKLHDIIKHKDEQVKQITLITGGKIDMWSMEDPNSGRGRKYKRAIIDEAEKARHLKDCWEQTIRATLVDYTGDAYFMSTPKFGSTYFKTDLFTNEQKFSDWKSWRFTTYDNPHIPQDEIDAARAQLAPLIFDCEYMALDVDLIDNPWAFAFSYDKHVPKSEQPEPTREEELYLSFDFNKNPICCSVIQHYDDEIKVLETIKLANSDIYALCDYILVHYPNYLYIVTGDATGQNSSALVRDNLNYYKVIKEKLDLSNSQMKVPKINPTMEENQVLVNSVLANYTVIMHKEKAKALIFDCQNVRMTPDGKIDKGDRDDVTKQADALDTFRYWINIFMWDFLKNL